MSPSTQINIEKVRHALSFFQAQTAQQSHSTLSATEVDNLIHAIQSSQSSQPLLKNYAESEKYEQWWKKTLRNDQNFKGDIDKAWETHKKLLQENSEQTQKNLFSFASTLSSFSKEDAFSLKDNAVLAISSISTLISITLNSIILNNSTPPDSNAGIYSSQATTSSFVLSYLANIFSDLQKGNYVSATLTLASTAYQAINLTISTASTSLSAAFLNTAPAILPFVGLGLLVAGAALNQHKLNETEKEIDDLKNKISLLEKELKQPSTLNSSETIAKTQQELFDAKAKLISSESTLKGQQFSRNAYGFYTALAVTSIVLAATAASVVTAGAFPAALAVGFGIAYLGAALVSKFQSHLRSNNEKQEQLSLKHEQLLTNIQALNHKTDFNFDKTLTDGKDQLTVNSYINTLIKDAPDNAQKLINSLDAVVKAHKNLEQKPKNSTEQLIAQKQLELEKLALNILLNELSPPPSKHISAGLLFETAAIKPEKEQKISIIENHIKNTEVLLGTTLFQPSESKSHSQSLQTFSSIKQVLTSVPEQKKPLVEILKQIVNTKIAYDNIPESSVTIRSGYKSSLSNLFEKFQHALLPNATKSEVTKIEKTTTPNALSDDNRFHKIVERLNESATVSSKSSIKILELLGGPGKIAQPEHTAKEQESFNKSMPTRKLEGNKSSDFKNDVFSMADNEEEELGSRISLRF